MKTWQKNQRNKQKLDGVSANRMYSCVNGLVLIENNNRTFPSCDALRALTARALLCGTLQVIIGLCWARPMTRAKRSVDRVYWVAVWKCYQAPQALVMCNKSLPTDKLISCYLWKHNIYLDLPRLIGYRLKRLLANQRNTVLLHQHGCFLMNYWRLFYVSLSHSFMEENITT